MISQGEEEQYAARPVHLNSYSEFNPMISQGEEEQHAQHKGHQNFTMCSACELT
jgi:hypothetical protein